MSLSRRSVLGLGAAGLAASTVGLPSATAAAAVPSVNNPSAASGTTGWSISTNGGSVALTRVANGSGSAFQAVRSSGSAGTWATALGAVANPTAFVPGTRYTLTAMIRNVGSTAGTVGVLLANSAWSHAPSGSSVANTYVSLPAGSGWRQVSTTFTAANRGYSDTGVYLALPPSASFAVQFTHVSVTAAATAAPPPSAAAGSATLSGAYVGAAGGSRATAWGSWRGRPVDFGLDYLDHGSQGSLLAALDQPDYWISSYRSAGIPLLVLGVPMIDDQHQMSLAAGASGAYDGHFANLARALVAHHCGNAILRVGWESNGTFCASWAGGDPLGWRSYYRRVVAAMRSVAGQSFRFDLTASNTSGRWGDAYPGDDVVDIIGVDVYDFDYSSAPGSLTGQQRWDRLAASDSGQSHWVSFAARTTGGSGVPTGGRKRLGVGEWAVTTSDGFDGHGGGDDADWVSAFRTWSRDNDLVYESYFDNGTDQLDGGRLPRCSDRYRTLFGAQG